MATRKLNVLVYAGAGSSIESVRHCVYSLNRVLSPNYAVITVTGDTLLKEPWAQTCALLVFPGGADLGYCRALNGAGNRRIRQYMQSGGSYMGFCAGGYYGSACCEFEVGDKELEVIGKRELQFFPGMCRGLAFKGFKYGSEIGTRAAEVKVNKSEFTSSGVLPELFRTYYNGGGVFVDADKLSPKGIEVLANYTDHLDVDEASGSAAVVFCKDGEGSAILTGPHPEFASINISKHARDMNPAVVDALKADDHLRAVFFKSCLIKLGLKVNEEDQSIPALTPLHLSSHKSEDITKIQVSWSSIISVLQGESYVKAEQDSFLIQEQNSTWSMSSLTKAALELIPEHTAVTDQRGSDSDRIVDYNEVIKTLIPHTKSLPAPKDTPYFSHQLYFDSLNTAHAKSHSAVPEFGTPLLYGQVVTSTSTLLEQNPRLTSTLPTGTVFTATSQLSGRGRGSNVWLSPAGSLMFSLILRHPLTLNATAPVVFVQYLAAIAVAQGIHSYVASSTGKTSMLPIYLKWPNDIYARDPNTQQPTKIGGILVNSSYAGGDYTLIVGIGLNVANAAPTVALDAVLKAVDPSAQSLKLEELLANILAALQRLYRMFCAGGFAGELEQLYYSYWLHSDQIVTIETEGGSRAQIKGITTDWGLLRAVEVESHANPRGEGSLVSQATGREFALQSDSNSFDFFNGLIKRKL